MVVAAEAATTIVVVVVMMIEDVITQNSKNATAVEKEGMMSCGEGYNLCSVKKEKKGVGLYFVCTKFIFMRRDALFYMQRLHTYFIVMDGIPNFCHAFWFRSAYHTS